MLSYFPQIVGLKGLSSIVARLSRVAGWPGIPSRQVCGWASDHIHLINCLILKCDMQPNT
jgi:hypothetical protein